MCQKKDILKTARLTLRPFVEHDIDNTLSILYSNAVKKTYMIPDLASEEQAVSLFHRFMDYSADPSRFVFAITLNDALIGWINDCGITENTIELGYVIHPDHQNRGYMTEALTACIEELFSIGFQTILCGYFEENPASHRVMLKAGMHDLPRTETVPYRGQNHICRYCEINATP